MSGSKFEQAVAHKLKNTAGVVASFGTRIYPMRLKETTTLPAAVYQVISNPRQLAHDGPTGLAFPRVQLSSYAATYAAAKAGAVAIREAIHGLRATIGTGAYATQVYGFRLDTEVDDYDPDTSLYTVRLDFLTTVKEN